MPKPRVSEERKSKLLSWAASSKTLLLFLEVLPAGEDWPPILTENHSESIHSGERRTPGWHFFALS